MTDYSAPWEYYLDDSQPKLYLENNWDQLEDVERSLYYFKFGCPEEHKPYSCCKKCGVLIGEK